MNQPHTELPTPHPSSLHSMKRHLIVLLSLWLLLLLPAARATVVYSGVLNVAIPQTFDGVYLRISDNTTSVSFPGDWNTAPWINPFFGGTVIGTSPLFLPVITGSNQGSDPIVNLTGGTTIDAGSNFASADNGSTTHTGPALNQFHVGSPGYIGYKFQLPGSGPDYYGWMGIQVNDAGAGTIIDWAYQNTAGAAIQAGSISAVPEPAEACLVLLLALPCACLLIRRRRQRVEYPHAL